LPPGAPVRLEGDDGARHGVWHFNPHSLDRGAAPVARPGRRHRTPLGCATPVGALALRERLYAAPFYRLVHAEADGLPGLVIDRYGDALAVQANTAGMDALLAPALLEALRACSRRASWWRATTPRCGPRRAAAGGAPAARRRRRAGAGGGGRPRLRRGPARRPEDRLVLRPAREPRPRGPPVGRRDGAGRLQPHRRLRPALRRRRRLARRAARPQRARPRPRRAHRRGERLGRAHGDAPRRGAGRAGAHGAPPGGERFDVVVADPPAFAKSRRDQPVALKGYAKLARLAAALVAPGGFLFLASCSHHVAPGDFADACIWGIGRARREGRILFQGGAGPDHPVHPMLPESAYLKAVLFQLG
jgi:23S rRNA (cytosine1962-C5)-methyltransferase